MLFQSQVFILLFLPAVLAAYYACAERPVLREAILILASLLFYAWWDPCFVPLLVVQTVATWLIAEAYFRWPARFWIVSSGGAGTYPVALSARLSLHSARRKPARQRDLCQGHAHTMGLCGLWHGAGWTFVVWGLLHGLALIVCHFWQAGGRRLPAALAWGLTILFVIVGWVLFRAADFSIAGGMLAGMAGFNGFWGDTSWPALLAAAAAVSIIGPTTKEFVEEWLRPLPAYGIAFALAAVIVVLEVGKGQPQSFIYFQF
jgi:D-alanyl-lipoteichoic acid acyltransferase DltB (MBOAT superfamily)